MATQKPRSSPTGLGGLLGRLWRPRVFVLVGAPGAAFVVGGALGSWQNLCAGDACPSIAQIQTWKPEQTSKLFSHDGRLIHEIGFERRTPVSIHALPEYVPQAVIAIEDHRFYQHRGFDPRGFARGVFGVLTGRNLGGGSTITQQLARNMFDEIGFERRVTRKFREIQVAFDLERSYSKDQILEAYLNEIYMGRGYGYQNAAVAYLGKNVADVNVAEAALLAAILNLPGRYDPFRRPENAKRRRDLVLTRMADVGYLTRAEAERWKQYPLPAEEPSGRAASTAPYFEEWVRQILDSRFGDEIYRSGLRVYTTLDVDVQAAAEEAMREGWAAIEADTNFVYPRYDEFEAVESFPGQTPYLQGAFVALDPVTGHVKAMIGGRDFGQSKFDRARLAERQAGSSFKPFVYTAAIASGIPASHLVVDGPFVSLQPNGEVWRPANFGEGFNGPMTIRRGLYTSTNMIAIKLGWEEVGIETVAQTARRMGIRSHIERFPSTTIGAAEVIPIEMAEAFSSFPTLGTKVRPFPILRVEDSEGFTLWEPQPERTQVLDSLVARIMVSMLEDIVIRGTAWTAVRVRAELPYAVPAAGKTGTTNDGTDVWFTGFTPNLLALAWFGMDRPVPICELGPGRRQATGGGLAAPVWGAFMKRVYTGEPATFLPVGVTPEAAAAAAEEQDPEAAADAATAEPSGPLLEVPRRWPTLPGLHAVLVDGVTGKLASRWCDEADQYVEYYIPGTEPTELCDRRIDRRFRIPRGRR